MNRATTTMSALSTMVDIATGRDESRGHGDSGSSFGLGHNNAPAGVDPGRRSLSAVSEGFAGYRLGA